ncbi:MAG: AAA family ATPase [Promethearchaeota archaeon]
MRKATTTSLSDIFRIKPIDVPIVATTGGKGGTGKTVVAINLATQLANMGKKTLIIDCDVDSPNVAILLSAELKDKQTVKRFLPEFILKNCTYCGKCAECCRAHAILQVGDKPPLLFPEICTGCEVCRLVCPSEAIRNKEKVVGYTFEGRSSSNVDIVSGELKLREPESAIAVEAARERAFKKIKENDKNYDIVVIDTAPGAHCDVIRALLGADLVLAVTEPTPFGAHDLDLIIELTKNVMKLDSKVVLNRSDIADSKIIDLMCEKKTVEMLAQIPYDDELIQSYVKGIPIVNYNPESESGKVLIQLAEKIQELLLA